MLPGRVRWRLYNPRLCKSVACGVVLRYSAGAKINNLPSLLSPRIKHPKKHNGFEQLDEPT